MNRYNSLLKLLPLLLLLLLSRSAFAFPETFEARYSFIAKGMVLGETQYRLSRAPKGDEAQYRFTTHTEPTGLAALLIKKIINEESYWKWQNGELRPLQYRYQQQGKKQKVRGRDFNWVDQSVSIDENGKQSQLNQLQTGAVDEALFLIRLMHDLKQQRKELIYPIVKKGKWSQYEFTRGPTETIKVPAGTFEAQQIVRKSSGNRSFRLWAAPQLDYLPVQVEYREGDGKLFLLKLKQTSITQKTL
ncbi:MAG: DUF3108 domain-containing protein [Gammaproteobacteria bacterium]|jgi:hypothetical protein|nr:DUF3108 domain-containing protein [Gammaproteobacteria bacterium]MBT4606362.1 DUF3108 domain-containing protein [Thiotrichales bacterium]MBT3472507.1 DUF3108 domain-containing protein [Gammaproteobacteria bacterium]MBT3967729.1 DUF3108 domain-containing protein [Gammaproteobacteria bacterium]MBT4081466.1 DUF3108 domain-containing protein [Gammaproteobacteria bacterium]